MPFQTPTLKEVERRGYADIDAHLSSADARVRRSYLGALSRSVAGAHYELWGYLRWISRQIFPDTADTSEMLRWAALWGIERRAAGVGAGTLRVTGATGTVMAAGTVWRSSAGRDYKTRSEARISDGGTADVGIVSVEAGALGGMADGGLFSLISPIAGIVATAVARGDVSDGTDEESHESVVQRLLERIQTPPRAGTEGDYRDWARMAHSAVTRVWVQPGSRSLLGTVTVRIMTDGATETGAPGEELTRHVQDYIDRVRPVTAQVTVQAPTLVPLNLTIRGLSPSRASVQSAIETEIEDLLIREARPGGTILISHLREAISGAAGEWDHNLEIAGGLNLNPARPNPVPTEITYQSDELPIMGDITWL